MYKIITIFLISFLIYGCDNQKNNHEQQMSTGASVVNNTNENKEYNQVTTVSKNAKTLLPVSLYVQFKTKIIGLREKKDLPGLSMVEKELNDLEKKIIQDIELQTKLWNKKDIYYLNQDMNDIMNIKNEFFQ